MSSVEMVMGRVENCGCSSDPQVTVIVETRSRGMAVVP